MPIQICFQHIADKWRNPRNVTAFARLKLWKSFVVLDFRGCVMCLCVFVLWVYRDLHRDLRGCLCMCVCVCVRGYVAIYCSHLLGLWKTTNAFFHATHASLLSANQDGETPPSRPMVRLPCLHAPRRQGPWLSIQASGARETRGGRKRGRQETGGEAITSWKGLRMHSSIAGSGEHTHSGHKPS